jgi:hypothetical protein
VGLDDEVFLPALRGLWTYVAAYLGLTTPGWINSAPRAVYPPAALSRSTITTVTSSATGRPPQ